MPQRIEGERDAALVSELPAYCQAPFRKCHCPLVVTLNEGKICGGEQCFRSGRRCPHTLTGCQCPFQEISPFTQVTMYPPEASQGSSQPKGYVSAIAITLLGLLFPSLL